MKQEEPCDNCNNDVCCCIVKEEPKQETLEEVAREYLFEVYQKQFIVKTNDIQHGVLKGFIEGAKWQQQQNKNLYSEEEVLKLLHNYRNHFELYRNIQVLPNDFFEWFNQNKKK